MHRSLACSQASIFRYGPGRNSGLFVSDTSSKSIEREGLGESRTGIRQHRRGGRCLIIHQSFKVCMSYKRGRLRPNYNTFGFLFIELKSCQFFLQQMSTDGAFYYMEESALLGTKPLVDSIRHFIRDPSGVFSVCHLCECRIVQ